MARRRLHAGPRASATGQRRRALPPPPSILVSLRRAGAILLQIRRDEWLEVTVHHPLHVADLQLGAVIRDLRIRLEQDRKSTRLNSSHVKISYAGFCLKKT